jgi:hypothetical protein
MTLDGNVNDDDYLNKDDDDNSNVPNVFQPFQTCTILTCVKYM